MNAARWKYLKALTPPAPRLFWVSNSGPWNRAKGTYNVGRNAEKRRRRDAATVARALTR